MNVPGPLSGTRRTGVAVALLVLAVLAVLVVTGVLSMSFQLMGPAGSTPPQGGFHVDRGGASATIHHDVGRPVDASTLQIRVNGEVRGTWAELSNSSNEVEVGESITIRPLQRGDVVALYWTGGNEPQKLLSKKG